MGDRLQSSEANMSKCSHEPTYVKMKLGPFQFFSNNGLSKICYLMCFVQICESYKFHVTFQFFMFNFYVWFMSDLISRQPVTIMLDFIVARSIIMVPRFFIQGTTTCHASWLASDHTQRHVSWYCSQMIKHILCTHNIIAICVKDSKTRQKVIGSGRSHTVQTLSGVNTCIAYWNIWYPRCFSLP